jgi:hypothetical protein
LPCNRLHLNEVPGAPDPIAFYLDGFVRAYSPAAAR